MNSSNVLLGTLKRIDARQVWINEARDFTPWLKANIDSLSEALGIELELPEIEVPVGDFSCDVVAQEVGTGHRVIIENQLEPTNHSHLGQVLTYAAGLDARGVVWISPQYRAEHRQAIDWLNANTTEDLVFFGVEMELLQIGTSPFAPHFKVVAMPNNWQKAVKATTVAQPTEKMLAYQRFFSELLERYKQQFPGQKIANKAPPKSWFTIASAGRIGFVYIVSFAKKDQLRVELYIDGGDEIRNKTAFDELEAQSDVIKMEIDEPLSWERLDTKKGSRIAIYHQGAVNDPEPMRTELLDWATAMIDQFRGVFGSRIQELQIN